MPTEEFAVTMRFPQPGRRLVSDVVSPGRVRLTATVDLVPDGDGTTVTETVRVTFPARLRRFVLGQARKVQRARAAELSRRLRSAVAAMLRASSHPGGSA